LRKRLAWGWLVPFALLAAAVAVPSAAADRPTPADRLEKELAESGTAIPVLVEITAPIEGVVAFTLPMAPGEVARGEGVEVAITPLPGTDGAALNGRWVAARGLEARPDGSAARVGVSLGGFDELESSDLPLVFLVSVRPQQLADPTTIEPVAEPAGQPTAERGREGVTIQRTALVRLVDVLLWRGEVARLGSSRPEWWDGAKARFPAGTDPNDLDAKIEFVQVAYAEKGRPHRAIRLFEEIAESALPDGEEAGAAADEGHLRSWLRACHEIAHLYEGALQDDARSLGWALRCGKAPLADPVEARQNRIAADLAVARAVEGMERRGTMVARGVDALGLYRLLARDLLLDPDPYGTLLLPQIFLHMGDLELETGADGTRGAKAAAEGAYRAALAAAGRLPEGVPSNYKAPGSAAQASLRRLSVKGLELSKVPDGEYRGEAFGYNAPIGVRMSFEGGRCTELHVEDLGDKRPLDAYRVLPERILESQTLEVDAVTGATVTSRAIVSAATEAVFEAVQGPSGLAGADERRAAGAPERGNGGSRGDH